LNGQWIIDNWGDGINFRMEKAVESYFRLPGVNPGNHLIL
jgi:hypothetical protein